jgi:glycosyltransferase involved in cell wall biosynthesis
LFGMKEDGMNKPLISIIVPVYNTEQYLSKCLDSLINQTYKNIEIICVNDGSTDNSADILNEYDKKR